MNYRMVSCGELIPKSAKVEPVWIKLSGLGNVKYELAFLTDDEKYFVSIDHRRVYLVTPDILWTKLPMPYEYAKQRTKLC